MPDLFETMQTMRAMRRLKPDPVPDELIGRILHAGTCAPSGGNAQKWRFLVLKDRKVKEAVTAWYKKAYDEIIGPRYSSAEMSAHPQALITEMSAAETILPHYHPVPQFQLFPSGSGMMVVMRSAPWSRGRMLTSALPRAFGAASGSRHTFSL